ncbi:MAG: hypothetical protein EPN93_12980 [Spirochaetes bacterium]|nr:MAG: hypothetical protein EPN93_12980 [Spirochaetota bacterium]
MTNRKKIILISSGSALALVIAAGIVFSLILRRTVSYDGEYAAAVTAGASISRDDFGVPTVRASGWEDAYFCLGYLHAQDRLLLIEYCRAAARGRLAELMGEDGFMIDKVSRVMGFSRSAGEILETLKQPHRARMEAYVRGINFLKNNKFRELIGISDVPGDDWTAADVIAVLLLSEWGNAFTNNRELTFVFPDELKIHPLKDMIPEELLYWYTPAEQKNVQALLEINGIISDRIIPASRGFAAFVAASRTGDGASRLIMNLDNPMHLFPLWYPVRIIINEKKIDGFTSAGLPFIWHGANGDFLFASFHLAADSQDFYIEETAAADNRQQYRYQGAWKDFIARKETLQAGRSRRSSVEFEFRATERGPVISDVFQGAVKTDVISIRCITPDESYIASLFEMPLAQDLEAARGLVTGVNSAPRVHLFVAGKTARKVYSGRIPQRNVAGMVFRSDARPGWNAAADLSAYARNDDGAMLVAGDSMIEDAPPELAEAMLGRDGSRLGRIREMLDRKSNIEDRYLYETLFDITSPHARKILSSFLQLLEKMPITSARLCRIYFNDWDLRASTDSVPATLFQTLLLRVIRDTAGDEFKGDHLKTILARHNLYFDRFVEMFVADKSLLFDDATTSERNESRDMLFDRAFLRAMRGLNVIEGPEMEKWNWGTLHKGRFQLPLVRGDSFFARRLYRSERVMVPGAHSTINLGGFSDAEKFEADMVTSVSAVIKTDGSLIAPLYGYSTNPFSDYFDLYVEDRVFRPMDATPSHVVSLEPAY